MTITTIYHVHLDVPDELAEVLRAEDQNRAFVQQYEQAIIAAFSGNVGSGSNDYARRDEWADFTYEPAAHRAEAEAQLVIDDFTKRAKEKA